MEVVVVEEPKRTTKVRKRARSGIPPPFPFSIEELYSILKVLVKDDVVVLTECKCEPT